MRSASTYTIAPNRVATIRHAVELALVTHEHVEPVPVVPLTEIPTVRGNGLWGSLYVLVFDGAHGLRVRRDSHTLYERVATSALDVEHISHPHLVDVAQYVVGPAPHTERATGALSLDDRID